jgi:hypothetical protein
VSTGRHHRTEVFPVLNPTRVAVATICLALLLAACGGGASSTSAARVYSAKELEALVPNDIGGTALQKFSMQGDEFVSSGGATEETEQFLDGLGVSTDDVAVAAGYGVATDTGDPFAVFVFQAEGAGSERLMSVFKQALDSDRDPPLEWEAKSVGGKPVEQAVDAERDSQVYLYAKGDVLFYLAATREEYAAEALEAMP